MQIGAIAVVLALGAGAVSAQSLGDIARQERQRRAATQQRSPVLTNEDFQRRRILEPVRERFPQPAMPVVEPVAETPVESTAASVQVSLGEYARKLREQKAARQRQQEEVRAAAAPTPVPQPEPAPVITTSTDRVRFHDTAGRPISLGEYARQLREDRMMLAPAPQVAVNQNPAPAPTPSVVTPRVSLGEYARRLQDARNAKRLESVVGVQRGDTLWKLSSFYLGRGELWTTLWKANPQITNPNLIHPGQLLRLPETTQLARHTAPQPQQVKVAAFSNGSAVQFAPPLPGHPLLIAGLPAEGRQECLPYRAATR